MKEFFQYAKYTKKNMLMILLYLGIGDWSVIKPLEPFNIYIESHAVPLEKIKRGFKKKEIKNRSKLKKGKIANN